MAEVPMVDAPVADAPVVDVPVASVPVVDVPVVSVPVLDVPVVDVTHREGHGERFRPFGYELHYQNMRWIGDNDIMLASIAGAGQTLVGNILLELGLNYVDLNRQELRPDGSSLLPTNSITLRLRPGDAQDSDAEKARRGLYRQDPRFMKTHLPAEELDGCTFGGVWILTRDPRDALYSWYRYRQSFAEAEWEKVDGSFEEFLQRPFLSGKCPIDDWSSFHTGWLERAQRCSRATVIRFEDVKRDAFHTMREALLATGLQIPDDELREAVSRSTFETMRAHEDHVAKFDVERPQARVMRKGKVGEWKEWMTPRLAAYFSDAELRAAARQFDYFVPAQP